MNDPQTTPKKKQVVFSVARAGNAPNMASRRSGQVNTMGKASLKKNGEVKAIPWAPHKRGK